jgi:hypothetical protein
MIGNLAAGGWVVLDEIQKTPALLDEVHRLMESRRWCFALCGSSARKLRRGGANLLAGRALTLSMESFSAAELGKGFDLEFALSCASTTRSAASTVGFPITGRRPVWRWILSLKPQGAGRAVGRGWLRSRSNAPSAGTGPGKNRCGSFRN